MHLANKLPAKEFKLKHSFPLPRKGARDRTPVLATTAVRHYTALTSLQSLDNSGQSCRCRALQCHKAGH